MFFNVEEAREFLKKYSVVFTLRPKRRREGRDLAVYGSYYKWTRIGAVDVKFVDVITDPKQLEGYVEQSGFETVEDWTAKAHPGAKFLFKVSLLESAENPAVFVEVRFLKDMPAIVGVDMKTYGPFKKGTLAALPKENASILIKMGVAEPRYKPPKKPTLKELMKGEVLEPYLEAARVKPLVEDEEAHARVGYRVGEPEETNAKKVIEFEVVELGNEHILVDVGKALNVTPTLPVIKGAIDERFGPGAEAIWLCDTLEHAVKRYGPGEAYSVEIPPDAFVISDLGPDGKLWIWRAHAEEGSIVRVTEKVEKVLREIREVRGE